MNSFNNATKTASVRAPAASAMDDGTRLVDVDIPSLPISDMSADQVWYEEVFTSRKQVEETEEYDPLAYDKMMANLEAETPRHFKSPASTASSALAIARMTNPRELFPF
jgi:hypothetical protein